MKKKKPARADIKEQGKTYNRKILRNAVKHWAGKKGYKPSQAVHRKWFEWSHSDLKEKLEKQIEEDEKNGEAEIVADEGQED